MANYRKKPVVPITSITSPVVQIAQASPIQPRTLRVAEVAVYLGVTVSLVRSLLKNKSLPAIRLGKRDLVLREDCDAFLNRQRERVAA